MQKSIASPEHLYIHIPFCRYICTFCDFKRDIITKHNVEAYVDQVIKELRGPYRTIYLGGGTPNALEDKTLSRLLHACQARLTPDVTYEFTVECNPDSVTASQVKIFNTSGVNRISLGIQTTNDALLKLLNRQHTIADAHNAITLLKAGGIDNVSADFIYNLPGSNAQDIHEAVKFIKYHNLPHCSFYALELKEGSVMTLRGEVKIDEIAEEEQLILVDELLADSPLQRYEVSNWALPQKQSQHNLSYWLTKEWQGIGYGAAGFEAKNAYSIKGTISDWRRENGPLSDEEYDFQVLMMGLRLKSGLDLSIPRFKRAYERYVSRLINCDIVNNHLFCLDINTLNTTLEKLL